MRLSSEMLISDWEINPGWLSQLASCHWSPNFPAHSDCPCQRISWLANNSSLMLNSTFDCLHLAGVAGIDIWMFLFIYFLTVPQTYEARFDWHLWMDRAMRCLRHTRPGCQIMLVPFQMRHSRNWLRLPGEGEPRVSSQKASSRLSANPKTAVGKCYSIYVYTIRSCRS